MINIKFNGKRFKIYASGKIKCLDECNNFDMSYLNDIINEFWYLYHGPEHGFPVSNMAHFLPKHGVEVLSYRDYEMENAPPDRIY